MITGETFDPVSGFIIVWLLVGSAIAFMFNLIGFRSLKVVGVAYAFSLVPAMYVALILSS